MAPSLSSKLIQAAADLRDAVESLRFSEPVTHVYNPLSYAWPMHELYLSRFGQTKRKVLFLGMNPGPWGMAQSGIPFGEIPSVRDWMKLEAPIHKPATENPSRPVEGLNCQKSEVSGRRLWGLFAERFPDPREFFRDHFVANYCPLVFMESTGRNRTPDKLPAAEAAPLFEACDAHLQRVTDILEPEWLIGIGGFAEKCFQRVIGKKDPRIATVLHPSPASPAANRGWAEQATRKLVELGVWS